MGVERQTQPELTEYLAKMSIKAIRHRLGCGYSVAARIHRGSVPHCRIAEVIDMIDEYLTISPSVVAALKVDAMRRVLDDVTDFEPEAVRVVL